MTINAKEIFNCKDDCEKEFKRVKYIMVFVADLRDTFQANRYYAKYDKPEKKYIKNSSLTSVGTKNYDKKFSS